MIKDRYLPPIILQVLGILLLIAAAIFWALTDRESSLIMGAAMTLIGLGAFEGIRFSFKQANSELTNDTQDENHK